jgi:hypothetical protein
VIPGRGGDESGQSFSGLNVAVDDGGGAEGHMKNKVEGLIDGVRFRSAFMPLGDGRHMLPVKEEIRSEIRKHAGDTVRVELQARLS